MDNKTKQLNLLININDHRYYALLRKYEALYDELEKSNRKINEINENIAKSTQLLDELNNDSRPDFIVEYSNASSFIKDMINKLDNESAENKIISKDVDDVHDKLIELKIESKGYSVLIDKHQDDCVKAESLRQYKELDEMWLIQRSKV